ncbi:hypothetical protein CSG_120 [Campylobacter fetus subsp. venerealis str. 84-112]|uniref:Uncharacterized protein n=1 Tax=Campylobacter fetus subsp. fetus (strain 82-40) TaxID=360106 RepID=A0RLY9_CAMFF|nr:hypothetical protein [Campylobacter fetus]ABK81744.1 hypothetical protein CFF8240_0012 [Campylobacter fetus subsp. fetus 82-40]CDF63932.1 hypothetical protein CSG_120 [Campylobacter fetus subsp. venerealis str. 84-112]
MSKFIKKFHHIKDLENLGYNLPLNLKKSRKAVGKDKKYCSYRPR